MPSFKDTQGREWSIVCQVNTLRRVKEKTGFLLTDLVTKSEAAGDMLADVLLMAAVIYWAVDPKVPPEDFESAFDDTVCTKAADALMEAAIGFFPEARRKALLEAWRKTMAVVDEQFDAMTVAMGKAIRSPGFEAHLRQTTSGPGSTSSPASSGSTPAPSRSRNSSRRGTRK